MLLFMSSVGFLRALLFFTSAVHGGGVDPAQDFCSLSDHMSKSPSSLLKYLHSLFANPSGTI